MAEIRFKGAVLAPWWKRAFSYLCDGAIFYLLVFMGSIPFYILLGLIGVVGSSSDSGTASAGVGLVAVLLGLVGAAGYTAGLVWYFVVMRGRTGRTFGARVMYLRLVHEDTGLPLGGGMTFLRALCHIIDAMPLGIGFLLPLFSEKKQTIADMIAHSVVVVDERPVPPHVTSWRRPRPPQDASFAEPQRQRPVFQNQDVAPWAQPFPPSQT